LRAYQQSSDFIASDPAAAAEIVATATGGDAGVFANNLPGQNFRVEITQVMVDSLDAIAGFLIDNGVLGADFDVREFMKLEAMEAVDPGLITADIG
jgi:ABC-type nitrate/sulfonate/bicarbonate transport system substrate-binding protein